MGYKVEELGGNMVKFTIDASAGEFEKALERAYQKNKGKISIQGFRKGRAPRQIVEKIYGAGIFYEDAANDMIPGIYTDVVKESGLDIVSGPSYDIVQIEKGSDFIFTAEAAVKPEAELGDYKNITVEALKKEVTEDDISQELDKERDKNARMVSVEGRAVENGDTAVIDYDGSVDGEAFDGGKDENFSLVIGSHSFIDTFEEQLIGRNVGDELDVHVTFPEGYHVPQLSGKPALFKVKIHEIKCKELPDADDEFAQDVSDFDTLAEYKESIRVKLEEKNEKDALNEKRTKVLEKLSSEAVMDIPEAMTASWQRRMADEYAQRFSMQGITFENYLRYTGMDADTFLAQLKPQALRDIKIRLALEAVVKAENIEAADEDVEKEFGRLAEAYNMEADKVKELFGEEEIKSMKLDICVQKAVDYVVDAAKVTEPKPETEQEEVV